MLRLRGAKCLGYFFPVITFELAKPIYRGLYHNVIDRQTDRQTDRQ